MPTYEYACKQCGKHVEVVQSFYDDPLTTCDGCGGELRKVFGNIGIVFKGSGFYKTDSRGGSSAAASSTSPGAASSETTAPVAADTSTSSSPSVTPPSSGSAKGSDSAA
ncbi:MAG: FmdB family zinc ribbon protein [Ferrimicrobium sp.]|jgi:putative FmdB family regulatory protein|uniref:FmdB family zinc ribbon protein n=1 Tax=Ferrimicrobium acidiphilum TaxID=121039 RepID=A0ABV3XYT6_9ACTN|nr:FmdB family zinc ribbon protein [Ferrimicrobium sp.]MCL5973935.1 FmdB family transcriptional regulator [Actinomycetota bacterium]